MEKLRRKKKKRKTDEKGFLPGRNVKKKRVIYTQTIYKFL